MIYHSRMEKIATISKHQPNVMAVSQLFAEVRHME